MFKDFIVLVIVVGLFLLMLPLVGKAIDKDFQVNDKIVNSYR